MSCGRPQHRSIGLILVPIAALLLSFMTACSEEMREVERSDASVRSTRGTILVDGHPFTGILIDRHDNGSVKSRTPYREGREEGEARAWYPDGRMKEKGSYENGRKIGVHTGWWENGSRRYRYEFVDDLHHGSAREWYPGGALFRSFSYRRGQEEGAQRMWNEDGSLKLNYAVLDGRRYGSLGRKECAGTE
jgi:antitoxin component YwqK of YwqJK toxin-antitoxin module